MKTSTLKAIERAMGEAAADIRMIADAAGKGDVTLADGTKTPKIESKPGLSVGWRAEKLVAALARQGLFVLDETTLLAACEKIDVFAWGEFISIGGALIEGEEPYVEGANADGIARAIVRELRP